MDTYGRELQVLQNVVEEVILGEFQLDHFVFELNDATDAGVKDVTQETTLLCVGYLIVALF